MSDFIPSHYEEITSQIPALHLLMHLGYEYLLPSEANQLRGGKKDQVILSHILRQFLQKQTFSRLGKSYPFSDKSIEEAIEALLKVEDVGLIQTNENIWHLLRLGKSFKETYEGGKADFNLNYIDWENPENNLYHVSDEFEIEQRHSNKTNRPDIVLFVNGIPFVTIECKGSGIEDPIGKAINQLRTYQKPHHIPHLFHYNQLLLALCYSEAQYGTVGTPKQFWSVWKEEKPTLDNGGIITDEGKGERSHPDAQEDNTLATLINTPLTPTQTEKLFTPDKNRFNHFPVKDSRQYYENNLQNKRSVNPQDRLIYALCRPLRLLEIADSFSLFDAGERKVARYQQYFTVKNILRRIHAVNSQGKRKGGIVWHTQGSGKSLTMVFLAEAIAKSSSKSILKQNLNLLPNQVNSTQDTDKISDSESEKVHNLDTNKSQNSNKIKGHNFTTNSASNVQLGQNIPINSDKEKDINLGNNQDIDLRSENVKDLEKIATIKDPKIILVTDRTDLDDQIYDTFDNCGAEVVQATTGKHLQQLLDQPKATIITTIINKFETVINSHGYQNQSNNIFVLVDESHRTQFGGFHTAMKRVLPNACFIGFTGTPVQKKEKSTVELFGGMIQPTYTIRKALEDKAVVPLLYESRLAELTVDAQSLDRWFERYTIDLNEAQKAKLKRHFATPAQLNQAEPTIEAIAWDITGHYCTNFQNRGLKAQLVTPNKLTAIKYKQYLDEFGKVSSEVLISAPNQQEGDENSRTSQEAVKQFWAIMMERYGTEKKYQDGVIKAFKYQEQPEIIIVVDKLLTGFDAPQNTILYLTRKLRDHRLLQAIARVNRLYEGKEYGVIIDYAGVLELLGDAIDLYNSLEGEYETGDLDEVIITLTKQWHNLEQYHSQLWGMFASITNRQDNNAFVELLREEKTRQEFNQRLSQYARCLQLALSSVSFFEEIPQEKIKRYKQDCKFFTDIRQTAARQFGDTLDLKQHQKTIQNLLNTHIKAQDVQTLVELTDIFEVEAFQKEINSFTTPVAQAEAIASRTIHTISAKFQEDETFYQPFSERLQEILREIKEKRYQDAQTLLKEAQDICNQVRNRNQRDDIPSVIRNNPVAQAYYGFIYKVLSEIKEIKGDKERKNLSGELASAIAKIIDSKRIVNWQTNIDVQNQMKIQIEDYLFDTLEGYDIELDFDSIDFILDKCISTAIVRLPDA
ncbi:type I restriction endonuclease subunit R [Cyanobacterium aponinum FACHB-4101]|uniref:type I restriction endonuclease subunit R n=1 Tax=Cyanobacterium aponinum TaxID=379064 RepID=UPI00167FED9E|nr:HsdR family type I site-specific deoxyribonuclease [Cyanobacterium aponinum]MBD2395853.1 type I restriction endonuclease subunit R [Cyanobacterium aponinum FACHB-4101]